VETLSLAISIPLVVLFSLVGGALLLVPPKTILRWDRKTGYWLYQRANTPEKGVLLAGTFYKILGATFIAVVFFGILPGIFG
jgi:hypothetical protein